MVNPLRCPLVLATTIVSLVLYVHHYRPRESADDSPTPNGAEPIRLRRSPGPFLTSSLQPGLVLQKAPERSASLSPPAIAEPKETEGSSRTQTRRDPPVSPKLDTFLPHRVGTQMVPSRDARPRNDLPENLIPLDARSQRLVELNRADTATQLASPPTSSIGIDPRMPRDASMRQHSERYHRIVDGDSLRQLAAQYLADEARYLEIYEANRDILVRPDLLPLGQKLRIPPR